MKTLVDRLKDRCRLEPATGCWIWKQAKCGGGHPMIEVAELGKSLNVRRLMYLIACGPIAKDRVISTMRTCSETDCVNPAHLQSIRRVDLNRQIAKSRKYHGGTRKKPTATWHPEVPSKINGNGAGGTSRKPPRPVLPATSAHVAGLLTAAAIGMARKSPTGKDGSCGPTSGQGQGEAWD